MVERRDPPHRIETPRLVLRCWDPADAPLLKEAVDASLEHLRPWMPWIAHEPQTVEQKAALLRGFRERFQRGEDFTYGIFTADEAEVVGGTGLHTRPAGSALELGYWIRESRLRQGLATEACAALTQVGLEHCRVRRLVIRIDPGNEASLGVPGKLGYRRDGTDVSPDGRRLVVFTLARGDYDPEALPGTAARAFDAAGRRVL